MFEEVGNDMEKVRSTFSISFPADEFSVPYFCL